MTSRHHKHMYEFCPGVEPFLHSDGTLYLLPVPGREQLQVDAPHGEWVHDLGLGREVPAIAPEERALFDDVVGYLADAGYLRDRERISSPDTSLHDRQVRWFGQEGHNGPAAQRTLAGSTVLVLGVGGLGGAVAELLARSGVGRLVLLDHDVVERGNLPRQVLYGIGDVGRAKIDVAADRLREVAPGIAIERVDARIERPEQVAQLVSAHGVDLVVCAIDRPAVSIKMIVERGALPLGVPVMHGGHRPPNMYAGPFTIPGKSACYDCFHNATVVRGGEELEAELSRDRDDNPQEFPAVVWGDVGVASLMAAQIVPWLCGIHDTTLAGRELELDMRTFEQRWIDPAQVGECDLCHCGAERPLVDVEAA